MNNYLVPKWVLEYNIAKKDAFNSLKSYKERSISSQRIRGSHQLLARYLLNFVIETWNESSEKERELGFCTTTNCNSLAKLCDCTSRSIRNQIKRLKETGIICRSEMTGRGLKVYLNPNAILCSFKPERKKDHPLVLEPLTVKNKTIGVDNTTKNYPKNTEEQRVSRDTMTGLYVKCPGTGSMNEHAKVFWNFAKFKIYRDVRFTERREKVLIGLVEKLFTTKMTHSDKDLGDVYLLQMKYLSYASDWFDRHPEVLPPDPYHFFSLERSGFRFNKIEAWHNQKERNLKQRRVRVSVKNEIKNSKESLGTGLGIMIKKHSEQISSFGTQRMNRWLINQYVNHKIL